MSCNLARVLNFAEDKDVEKKKVEQGNDSCEEILDKMGVVINVVRIHSEVC